jgi:hypothetical protein
MAALIVGGALQGYHLKRAELKRLISCVDLKRLMV